MVETTNDIKKQIQSTLKELREQKERYIKRIDVVMQEIKNIENVNKKIHEYDSLIKDADNKTSDLKAKYDANNKLINEVSKDVSALEQRLKRVNNLAEKQDEISKMCNTISQSISKLRTSNQELANNLETLTDRWDAMKKSNLYKTLKLLDSDSDEFYKKVADYIVKHIVARQKGVFGSKDIELELISDNEEKAS